MELTSAAPLSTFGPAIEADPATPTMGEDDALTSFAAVLTDIRLLLAGGEAGEGTSASTAEESTDTDAATAEETQEQASMLLAILGHSMLQPAVTPAEQPVDAETATEAEATLLTTGESQPLPKAADTQVEAGVSAEGGLAIPVDQLTEGSEAPTEIPADQAASAPAQETASAPALAASEKGETPLVSSEAEPSLSAPDEKPAPQVAEGSTDARSGDGGEKDGKEHSGDPNNDSKGTAFSTGATAIDPQSAFDTAISDVPPEMVVQADMPEHEADIDRSGRAEQNSPLAQTIFERPTAAAWIRSMIGRHTSTMTMQDGWQVMDMNLEADQGSVTVKTKREENHVSVSVGFSDPNVASLLQANAAKIEQVLQAQYETSVDLSFFERQHGRSAGSEQDNSQKSLAGTLQNATGSATGGPVSHQPRPRILNGAREWIG